MKKLYYLLLLCSVTAMAAPPPVIQNPTPLEVCDGLNNDGFAEFNLNTKDSEILGALNPSLYWVNYYETLTDAQNSTNSLSPFYYTNITPNTQTVYVRVFEIAAPSNFAMTTLQLIVNPLPTAILAPDMVVSENPFDGIAIFDLTANESTITGGATGMILSYYMTEADAAAGIAPLTDPSSFTNTVSPQKIWVRVQNLTTGCFSITYFNVAVIRVGVVYIPDPNFKAKLIADGVDTDSDGEIQFAEADVPTAIDLNNLGIADMNGIQSFHALQTLNVANNQILSLNLSGLTNLVTVDCSLNNTITSINLSGLANFKVLHAEGNHLTSLDFTGLNSLEELHLNYNDFTSLDVSGVPSLKNLQCIFNNLSSLNIGSIPNLNHLDCHGNAITTLNASGASGLQDLNCMDNGMTSLNVTGLANLNWLGCSYNPLNTLDLSGLNLQYLTCGNNNLTSLDISGMPALNYLICWNNSISTLDFTNHPALTGVQCNNNQLTSLDFSTNPLFQFLQCDNNPLLETIIIKNGNPDQNPFLNDSWANLPQLTYVCADEGEIDMVNTILAAGGNTSVSVNTYCSFTPGGDYNTISATTQFDEDNNGCNINDDPIKNLRFNIFDQTTSGAAFTDASGLAQFYTQAGSFDVSPSIENPSWFTISPATINIPFANNNNNTASQNFCIAPVGSHRDLEVVIAPLTTARPGFQALYKVVFRNKGNFRVTQLNGVEVMYDTTKMDYVSAGLATHIGSPGDLYWDILDLMPFESRSFVLTMYVHAPTEITPVNNGDILHFDAHVTPIADDENPTDNNFSLNQIAVGSFDPNEIICLEGNIVSPLEIGNYLHYAINFENTGTADAENIVVRDVIDTAQFDINSLRLLDSSALVTARITGNVVEFIFPNINLHSGGHGNILLKVRSNNTLVEGDSVSKRANIYFDYNLPVETLPENTVFQSLSNPDVPVDASISIYPNPTRGNVNINCNNTIKSIQLYDIQGRLLQTSLIDKNETSIDISNQANGVYFVKIISDKGMGVKKIVKE
ncbi:T9SS type A sorting domain-containing protein [Flavobacterium wongokense]|uniref:T9SS type A sorting domain-containing protein n=1 Tax=Flavobacterium wongokense TaxID=2910674 RepID=UPI001F15A818|nr:T9SS type A sorting domain-containing protein [Flavobacterium sp. WG47]MCF6132831.1 T9SS type A sorting domain-containing protein [Flavobacterium sp. WG47]